MSSGKGRSCLLPSGRSLKDREKKYSVSELECLAIVDGILHFAPYLRQAHFVVETDHHDLSFLKNCILYECSFGKVGNEVAIICLYI